MKQFLSFVLLILFSYSIQVNAQSNRQITFKPCPFSCKTEGIPKSECRDWRKGNVCYIEKTSPSNNNPANNNGQKLYPKGFVTARYCPFNCQSAGLSHSICKDWREGELCYVENLTQPPGFSGPVVRPTATPSFTNNWPPTSPSDKPGIDSRCNGVDRFGIARPHVNIYQVKPIGNVFKDKYRVSGSVEGVCISEAGYFEEGRKKQDIPITTTRNFKRFDFQVEIRSSKYPEIRAYNVTGERYDTPIRPDESYEDRRDHGGWK